MSATDKRYILTSLGYQFDFDHPTPERVDILDIARALSNICRFTGHVRQFYSVAQHSVIVSQLVEPEFAFEGLMHDAAEAYVGDMSSPLKRVVGAAYKDVEHRVEAVIRTKYGLPPKLSPEVKKADWIALGIEAKHLLPPDTLKWPELANLAIPDLPFRPLDPEQARMLWLERFYLLTGEE